MNYTDEKVVCNGRMENEFIANRILNSDYPSEVFFQLDRHVRHQPSQQITPKKLRCLMSTG